MLPRAVSWLEVANRALIRLGQTKIQSLTEGTQSAAMASLYLEEAVNHVAAYHRWRGTIARLQLAASSEMPVSGFDYQYPLPNDFLSLAVDENGPMVETPSGESWSIENGNVLTNATELYITYHKSPDSPAELHPAIVEAITYVLAWKLAPILTSNDALTALLNAEKESALTRAVIANGGAMVDRPAHLDRGWTWPDEAR